MLRLARIREEDPALIHNEIIQCKNKPQLDVDFIRLDPN